MDLFKNQPKTSVEEEDCCQFALQLSSASVLPMVLKTVIELGVLEIIRNAGLGAHISTLEIVSNLPTKNPEAPIMLERMLRLLASHSVLTCSVQTSDDGEVHRLYGLGPVCKHFVQSKDEASLASFLCMLHDKVFMESWYHLKDAVLEGGGGPFSKAHGMNAPEYLGKDLRFGKVFKQFIVDYNIITMEKIFDTYKGFESVQVLVDVGGGDGSILNMIISKYPSITAINFDLPEVIQKAPSYPGVKNVGGDMFLSVPKGDAIFMKWILHCWNDENCLKLLRNCYETLPNNGKVIAVDLIIPAISESSTMDKSIFQLDLSIMTSNIQGKERTQKEFEALAKQAGFSGIRVLCCAFNFSLMEFYKTM